MQWKSAHASEKTLNSYVRCPNTSLINAGAHLLVIWPRWPSNQKEVQNQAMKVIVRHCEWSGETVSCCFQALHYSITCNKIRANKVISETKALKWSENALHWTCNLAFFKAQNFHWSLVGVPGSWLPLASLKIPAQKALVTISGKVVKIYVSFTMS